MPWIVVVNVPVQIIHGDVHALVADNGTQMSFELANVNVGAG